MTNFIVMIIEITLMKSSFISYAKLTYEKLTILKSILDTKSTQLSPSRFKKNSGVSSFLHTKFMISQYETPNSLHEKKSMTHVSFSLGL
jgi:hypothetical protein